jgi:plasmid maintenance system killer protein
VNVSFGNRKLEALYTSGKSTKYRLPPQVLKKFFMRMQSLEAATSIYDFWKNPALNFKSLAGTDRCSVRVDGAWRLEFTVAWEDDPPTKGAITVTELSNHYGD